MMLGCPMLNSSSCFSSKSCAKSEVFWTDKAHRDEDGGRIGQQVGCIIDQKFENGWLKSNPAPGRSRLLMRPGHVRKIAVMLNKENTGTDDAENSSNKLKVNYSRHNSYRRSIHIAMINEYLGLCGAVSPVKIRYNGKKFTFDFYYPEGKRLVKIFNALEAEQIGRYASLPTEGILFIINGNRFAKKLGGGVTSLKVEDLPNELHGIVDMMDGLLYFNDAYWRANKDPQLSNKWARQSSIPFDVGYEMAMEDASHRE